MELKKTIEKTHPYYQRLIAAALGGAISLSGMGIYHAAQETHRIVAEETDLSIPGLSTNQEALKSVIEKHGPVTKFTIKPGTENLTQFARELNAVDTEGLIGQLTAQTGEYMHIGDVVVIANDQLKQPEQPKG